MVMRRFSPWLLAIVLSGCSALQGTPEAPPPATDHPQEIQRYQTIHVLLCIITFGQPPGRTLATDCPWDYVKWS